MPTARASTHALHAAPRSTPQAASDTARSRRSPARLTAACLLTLATTTSAVHAENRIDVQRPDAPELAAYGPLETGVRPIDLVNPDQVDVVAAAGLAAADPDAAAPDPLPRHDRPLRVEVWYPAFPGATGSRALPTFLRDGRTPIELTGRSVQYAAPAVGTGDYPLVIVSHGYPGNRFLMSHLADNLASKGYVVASIDHTDSTYRTLDVFGSTLRNRTLDQLFVLDEMERLNADPASFLSGLVDASRTGIVGYSMGGYGALVTAGSGVTSASIDFAFSPPFDLLDVHEAGSESETDRPDPRIRTAIAFAPWGRQVGFFDADTLAGITIPTLYVAGSVDDVSGYEDGTRAAWEDTVNAEAALLTFDNANHNAAAPMPAPQESYAFDERLGFAPFEHYADPVWDTVRMNNVAQHFATAWLDKHLKGDADKDRYLDLIENANEGVYDVDEAGEFTPGHTYWAGFAERTAKGLRFERRSPGE